ncbi:outer membrane beta-barrel protein [Putridiphycobacter roseus]|nr:outer membrane beta-barrel protein [Putridiphycobacter roseus]
MKIIFTLLALFIFQIVIGQNSADRPFNLLNRKPGVMRHYSLFAPTETSAEKFDRLNTHIFFNNWLGNTQGVATKFYAIGHGLNLSFDIPFSKNSIFGIGIGLGYTHYNIRHDGNLIFESAAVPQKPTPDYTLLKPYTGQKRWINRTVFNQIDVPFELRIRSRKERHKVKLYPGFKVGYIFDNYQKWRVNDLKYKSFNFPDVQHLQYGATLRLGMDNIFLFGEYNLSYLFENKNSTQLNMFSVGISIGWF